MNEGNDVPQFAQVGQKIAAAAMLLRGVLEPVDPQERAVYRNLRVLVEAAAVQQAESSASGERGRARWIAPFTRRYSRQPWPKGQRPHHGPT